MTLDPSLLREAQEVLRVYSSPAQEMIKLNLYGPREARLAGALVAKNFTVVSYQGPDPVPEQVKAEREEAVVQINALCELLRRATAVIEERVAGQEMLLRACEEELSQAEANYDDGIPDMPTPPARQVFVVVFPTIDLAGKTVVTTVIDDFVKKLRGCGITVWVADETDQSKRLKAMTMREIYNVGRVASVVLTTEDGTVLDGWYNGMPWIDETLARVRSFQ